MRDRCALLVGRLEIVGPCETEPYRACLRPVAHDGPHLILSARGTYVTWEDDPCSPGECYACDGEDPSDKCLAYGTVTEAEARRLIASEE